MKRQEINKQNPDAHRDQATKCQMLMPETDSSATLTVICVATQLIAGVFRVRGRNTLSQTGQLANPPYGSCWPICAIASRFNLRTCGRRVQVAQCVCAHRRSPAASDRRCVAQRINPSSAMVQAKEQRENRVFWGRFTSDGAHSPLGLPWASPRQGRVESRVGARVLEGHTWQEPVDVLSGLDDGCVSGCACARLGEHCWSAPPTAAGAL